MKNILVLIIIVFLHVTLFGQSELVQLESVLNKAITRILADQDLSGGWSRVKDEFPVESEPTSWAVKVLALNNVKTEQLKKGVQFILNDQKLDGSWNNNTAHTAFAVLALREVGYVGDAISKALQYFKKVQLENGGFSRIGTEGNPLSIYTAVVLCALKEASVDENTPMVKKAIEWLLSCQNQDGGFGMTIGTPSLAICTAWAIKSLMSYGYKPGVDPINKAIRWLLTTQKESGGFSMTSQTHEDPEVTAYVILALSPVTELKGRLLLAVDYLSKVQTEDGAFVSDTPIQFKKVPKKNTQTTCFVAWALSELRIRLGSLKSNHGK